LSFPGHQFAQSARHVPAAAYYAPARAKGKLGLSAPE